MWSLEGATLNFLACEDWSDPLWPNGVAIDTGNKCCTKLVEWHPRQALPGSSQCISEFPGSKHSLLPSFESDAWRGWSLHVPCLREAWHISPMVSLAVFNLIACTANQLCQPIYQSTESNEAYNSAVVEVMAPLDCSNSHIKPALNSKGKDADFRGIWKKKGCLCVSLNYQGIKETVIHLSNWNS